MSLRLSVVQLPVLSNLSSSASRVQRVPSARTMGTSITRSVRFDWMYVRRALAKNEWGQHETFLREQGVYSVLHHQ